MKISEIVKREEVNKNIILLREGSFWRAYEYSAFLFVNNIKAYNVMHKYFKNIGQDIVYIGFPNSYLEEIIEICSRKNYTLNKDSEKIMTIKGFSGIDGFDEWKEEVVSKEKIAANIKEDSILKQISDFPLASKTPIEAQQFLDNIQKQINGNL